MPDKTEFRIVFDGEEWRAGGFDQPEGNLRFNHAAEVLEHTTSRYGEPTMTVRFLHTGKVSHGHFVSYTHPVGGDPETLAQDWCRGDGWKGTDDPECRHGAQYLIHAARVLNEVTSAVASTGEGR